MAVTTSLKIQTRDANLNNISKTVGNVNPAASDYVLKTFAENLTSLSNNNFAKVERIDTKDITSATQS